ncbi:MAG: aminopeptidase 1 [Coriobacteriaceae bacterium]|jgi:aspartyl aminopeptidase|nr:aminopeptidase 1 [Coriobacteriaceae bacterium]
MEYKSVWKNYTEEGLGALEAFAEDYIGFISTCKTERECASFALSCAKEQGYSSLDEAIADKKRLKPGDKVWAHAQGKALILVHVGTEPIEAGLNILGAHIDSPRLDVKQNPLYESNDLALLDTHYYGGIKHYQWVTTPLAIHGVVTKKTGESVEVVVGEDAGDPVFCVTDLLPHLAAEQMDKKARTVVEGENLDVLVGNRPLVVEKNDEAPGKEPVAEPAAAGTKPVATAAPAAPKAAASTPEEEVVAGIENLAEKEPVKAMLLKLLFEHYGIEEKDFLSAELEVVPAGPARDCGFDRSMVIGYGQDDRVCAYPSLRAQLAQKKPKRTCVCIFTDKEEVGSIGATGMASRFFENTIAEVMELAGEGSGLALRRALTASHMLSSDVGAGFDPLYPSVFEAKNAAYLGRGLVLTKYTGARGKNGSNDASAEYVAKVRAILDGAGVAFHTSELGRVDAGGGGTIAYISAEYGMNVIDSGVAVLSMHSPWEVASKADIYEAYKGYQAFLRDA